MSKRIKVLITTSNFKTAGSGKVIFDLVKGLDKTKYEVAIACKHNKGDYFKTIESLDVPIHIFDTKTNYRPYTSLFSRIRKISKFFKTHEVDIVHSWQWSNDWTEALAAKWAGAKWIYTKKAMGFESKHWQIKSYLADFIITINDEMRANFPKKKNQQLIPLGIDTNFYSPEHFEHTEPSKHFEIITVANLVAVKGIEILIKAIHLLADEQLHLTIVGDKDNPYGRAMEALTIELGLEQTVKFMGKQPDVRAFIAKSDLYVIPTLDEGRKEGMPMALVEAMSMGIPVLGSNISGIKFVLKAFPDLLFEAAHVEGLSKSIAKIKALKPEAQKEIGQNLRQYCERNFTLKQFVGAHESLYAHLLNGDVGND